MVKETKQPDSEKKNRDLALQTAIDQILKNYGKGSIMRLGGSSEERTVAVIPTGSIALDLALGVGGVTRVRIVEIYGP